jgi:hypothetical protein
MFFAVTSLAITKEFTAATLSGSDLRQNAKGGFGESGREQQGSLGKNSPKPLKTYAPARESSCP